MTDRELLEAAAKAIGLQYEWHQGCGDALHLTAPDATAIYWSPLTNDGDALRLAVKRGIDIVFLLGRVDAYRAGLVCSEYFGDDIYAATRRAIVRAAAAMVKP
jgi:hypothetical protein